MNRDQFLAEMIGEQYPRYNVTASGNKEFQNFSLWPDKGRLLDFVMAQEWWGAFHFFAWVKSPLDEEHAKGISDFTKYLIDSLPDLVAEYRGWKK